MLKPVKWTSLADTDLSNLLEYLFIKWKQKVTLEFIENPENCVSKIEKNPELFPFYDKISKLENV